MNAIEELLSEEVRRYEHLYNPSMAGYKDAQMASNSWREISSNVVLAVDLCLKMWRKLRDKYVREKKAILLPFFIAFLVGQLTTMLMETQDVLLDPLEERGARENQNQD
ncbi:hypothetical protein EYF80_037313 [Liparis tanakae]|uniref:MADF domain-containing protein n=1 Tax=Liparis tanakae TaxID=230148 RepID=A0A4Z2GG92_9TELE|nr:hypothetical protein EYF80_037313 [Liparis tanakae]